MKYVLATNFGKGFITHEDQEKDGLKFRHFPPDLTIVSGTDDKIFVWIERVKGKEITEIEAKSLLHQRFNKGKLNELAELTKQKTEIEDRVFDLNKIKNEFLAKKL